LLFKIEEVSHSGRRNARSIFRRMNWGGGWVWMPLYMEAGAILTKIWWGVNEKEK